LSFSLHAASFSINNNKSHKSRLEYEIEYDPYKIAQANKKPKMCSFLGDKKTRFSKPIF